MTFPSVVSFLKKYHIHPQKRLGQNFLIAPPTLEKIVSSLEVKVDDTVLEIGPGLGVMTAMIAERCQKVIAIEKDSRLLDIARSEFGYLNNIEWIEADFLQYDLKLRENECTNAQVHLKIIGNIPYEITSPVLFKLLGHADCISTTVLLMQKEVAMRIVAKPRTKTYGILSVCCQAAATCERLFDVSAKSFIPPPKVTSSVVKLNFKTVSGIRDPGSGEKFSGSGVRTPDPDAQWFCTVVRAAFGKRRKTLRNALLGSALGIDAVKLDQTLDSCGISGTRRPEELSVEEFLLLARSLDNA